VIRTYGIYEAKTNFNRIISEVEAGREIIITRHGTPVAKIVPLANDHSKNSANVIAELGEFRKQHSLGGVSIKDLINEGRKY